MASGCAPGQSWQDSCTASMVAFNQLAWLALIEPLWIIFSWLADFGIKVVCPLVLRVLMIWDMIHPNKPSFSILFHLLLGPVMFCWVPNQTVAVVSRPCPSFIFARVSHRPCVKTRHARTPEVCIRSSQIYANKTPKQQLYTVKYCNVVECVWMRMFVLYIYVKSYIVYSKYRIVCIYILELYIHNGVRFVSKRRTKIPRFTYIIISSIQVAINRLAVVGQNWFIFAKNSFRVRLKNSFLAGYLRSNGMGRHIAVVRIESSWVPENAKNEMRNSEIHHYVL